jgi:group I intron endonuclease
MKSGIYTITCLINNKVYVGRSKDWKKRLKEHKSILNKNQHLNQHLQSAWNKYREENFTFELLEEYEEEFLPSMEHWWCNMLNVHNREFGYNIEPTSPFGMTHLSKETKEKLSKSLKGRVVWNKEVSCTQETKDKIKKTCIGKKTSAETKEKQKKAKLGKKHTNEAKENMKIAQKGRTFSTETLKKMSEAKKGKPSHWKGKKHTEESIEKMKQVKLNKKN